MSPTQSQPGTQPGVTSEVCEDDGRLHVVVHVGAWGAILAAKPHPCQGQGAPCPCET